MLGSQQLLFKVRPFLSSQEKQFWAVSSQTSLLDWKGKLCVCVWGKGGQVVNTRGQSLDHSTVFLQLLNRPRFLNYLSRIRNFANTPDLCNQRVGINFPREIVFFFYSNLSSKNSSCSLLLQLIISPQPVQQNSHIPTLFSHSFCSCFSKSWMLCV